MKYRLQVDSFRFTARDNYFIKNEILWGGTKTIHVSNNNDGEIKNNAGRGHKNVGLLIAPIVKD